MLMRGAVVAKLEGIFEHYYGVVSRHIWDEPKKIDDPYIFSAALSSSGLDEALILRRAQQDEVKQILIDNTEKSVARGSFGVPTYFVGDEMFFGKDQLAAVEECIFQV